MPELDSQGIGEAVHGHLVLVLGVHHQKRHRVLIDELLVFTQPVSGTYNLLDSHVHTVFRELFPTGADLVMWFFEELAQYCRTGVVGIDRRNLGYGVHVVLKGTVILDVGEH